MAEKNTIRHYLDTVTNNESSGLNGQKVNIYTLIEKAINSIEVIPNDFESIRQTISSVINYLMILIEILKDKKVTYFENDPDYEKTASLAISLDNLINNLNNLQPSDEEIINAGNSLLDSFEKTCEEPKYRFFKSAIDELREKLSCPAYTSDFNSNSNSQNPKEIVMPIIRTIDNNTPETFDLNWIFNNKDFEIISNSIFESIQQIKKIIDDSIINSRLNSDSTIWHILKTISQSIPKAKPNQEFYLYTSAGLVSLSTLKNDPHRDYKLNTYYHALKNLQNDLLELLNKLNNMPLDSTKLNQHIKKSKHAMSLSTDVVSRILKAYIPAEFFSKDLEEFVNVIQSDSYDSEDKKIRLLEYSVALIESSLEDMANNSRVDKSQNNNTKFLKTQVIPTFQSYLQSIKYIKSLRECLDTLKGLINNYNSYFFANNPYLKLVR